MPVSYRILPRQGLVYFRYEDRMTVELSSSALDAYLCDPDYTPGHKQLIDLAAVTDWERDFTRILAFQARVAEAIYDPTRPALVVAYAPTPISLQVANFVSQSWDGVDGITYLVADNEPATLELLGLAERNIAELLTTA